MDHGPNIGFVDSKSKGNGGDDNPQLIGHETVLNSLPLCRSQTSMIVSHRID